MRSRSVSFAMAMFVCVAIALPVWAGNGQNLLQYVPQETGVVMSVDLEQLRATPLFELIWGIATADPEISGQLAELETAAGFNPTTDLSTFLFAMNADDDERFLVLVEGTFDSSAMAAFIISAAGEEVATTDYQGFTVYHEPPAADAAAPPTDDVRMTFITDTIVALGTQTELNAAIDTVAAAGANVTANASLNDVITAADSSGTFWFAGTMSPAMTGDVAGSPMASMANFRGSGNLAGGVTLSYVLGTGTEADATALSTFITDSLNEARAQPELAQLGLTSVLDATTVGSAGTDVSIDVAIPEQTLNQIIMVFQALMQAEGGF